MKKIVPILILLFMMTGLTGCWSARELTDLAIAGALGIDKTDEGYRVSVQLIIPAEIAAQKGGDGLAMSVYSAEGKTIIEALRRLTSSAPRMPYLAHLRVVVFGEEAAKAGIRKPLDFLSRYHEMRTDFVIAIAKGEKAEDLLSVLTPMEKIAANKIFSSLEHSEKNWAPTIVVQLDDLIASIVSSGKDPIMPGIEIIGDLKKGEDQGSLQKVKRSATITTSDIGILKDDRLVGWLNENESKGFNYIVDNITRTVGFIDCDGGTVSTEVIRSKTDMKGTFEKGKPKIQINVKTEADIADVECPVELTKPKAIHALEKKFNKKTKKIILGSIDKAKEFKSDIFGFGEAMERADPKRWEKLKNNWGEEFSKLDVEVKVDVEIRRMGTISESFQKKDE